jgi:hypothetical protein
MYISYILWLASLTHYSHGNRLTLAHFGQPCFFAPQMFWHHVIEILSTAWDVSPWPLPPQPWMSTPIQPNEPKEIRTAERLHTSVFKTCMPSTTQKDQCVVQHK